MDRVHPDEQLMPPEANIDPTPTPTPAPAPQGGKGEGFDINTVVAGMLQRANGDASKVLKTVLKENKDYRDSINAIKSQLPAPGSAVLGADDAKRWEAYRQLGDDPAAIKAAIDTGSEAARKWAAHETGLAYDAAAKAAGYHAPLFKLLAKDAGIQTVVEDVPDGKGKVVPTSFVVDAKGGKTPLADYAKANWGEHLDMLGAGSADPKRYGNGRAANDNTPPPIPGVGGSPDVNKALNARNRYSA